MKRKISHRNLWQKNNQKIESIGKNEEKAEENNQQRNSAPHGENIIEEHVSENEAKTSAKIIENVHQWRRKIHEKSARKIISHRRRNRRINHRRNEEIERVRRRRRGKWKIINRKKWKKEGTHQSIYMIFHTMRKSSTSSIQKQLRSNQSMKRKKRKSHDENQSK